MATLATGDRQIDLARAEDFDLGPARVRPPLLQIVSGNSSQLVEPRVMQMLVALHRAQGAPLARNELIELCWGGLAVSDDAITQCVSKLRRALACAGISVVSVPRVGYRLDVPPAHAASPGQGRGLRIDRRTLMAGAAVAAGGALAAGGAIFLTRASGASDGSIAVLPFANLSNDPAQAYLSDGIAEEVRNALARLSSFKVVGRTSSELVRGMDATAVAARLHVANVLIGSVRRSPTTIRVAAQLVDGRTGFERWSHSYDLAPGDALQIQSDIAEGVALALSTRLIPSQRVTLTAGGTSNATAHDLYLQARTSFSSSDTEAAIRKVIALCNAALELDPAYANALALEGIAWDALGSSFATDAQALAQAYASGAEAGRRAVALAPQLAAGYVAIARAMSGRLNVRGALEQYRRAGSVARGEPGMVSWWIQTLAQIGRTGESLALADKLIALDPLNAAIYGRQAFALFFARNYRLAIEAAHKALALAPNLGEQQSLIGDCLCQLGRYEDAAAHYSKAPPLDPYRLTGLGIIAARRGNRAECERVLDRMTRGYGDPISYQVAQIKAQLGAFDEAFAALARARAVLDPGLNGLPADPFIDPLRGDPRLARLIGEMDFPR
jgi:serine/threonine-protein kinase